MVLGDLDRRRWADQSLAAGFLCLCYCRQGWAAVQCEDRELQMHQGDVLLSVGGQQLMPMGRSTDFSGALVVISRTYTQDCIEGLQDFWPYLLYVVENPVIHLDPLERQRMEKGLSMLHARLGERDHRYHREMITALLRMYYFDICNLLARRRSAHLAATDEQRARPFQIFDHFIRLASEQYRDHRGVEWYGRELCLSPKYLSEMVKTVSGRTAGQWLASLTVMEIKFLLRQRGLSIKEIAGRLHFPSQSLLSKYFKQAAGLTPSDYRNAASLTLPHL